MPQDIPLEASDTLVFIPDCLAEIEAPPRFLLRTPTTREKRFQRRLLTVEGVTHHSVEALREEMLKGLRELWGEATYAAHAPILEAYWQAGDDFAVQQKDDPDLTWEYDAAIEAACEKLEVEVAKAWPALATMRADNVEATDVTSLSVAAVTVKNWSGLSLEPKRERGYLTIDSVHELRDALGEMEADNGVRRGTAWMQLFLACSKRMFLDKDEEKNSASPSPSETPPQNSKPGKAAKSGSSPASASSTETPVSA